MSVQKIDMEKFIIFRQIYNSMSNDFTYLIGCSSIRLCVIIDPTINNINAIIKLLDEHKLSIKYIVNTCNHPNNTAIIDELKTKRSDDWDILKSYGATECKQLINNEKLFLGIEPIKVITTPGYTQDSISLMWRDRLFSGDTIFCGNTVSIGDNQIDFPEELYDSVTEKLFKLPNDTLIYPGHCYYGRYVSTIAEEKRLNPFFKNKEEFLKMVIKSDRDVF